MNHRIKSLDGLRGILCLLVVFHHYDAKYIPSYLYNNFLIRQADLLVDFFFIISGFVISNKYKKFDSIKDVGTFLKKRILRLYPLLLFSTILFFLFEIFTRNLFGNFINKEINNYSLLKSFIDTILLNNSTPLFGNSWGINRPTWSISAEFYAYMVFSCCILLVNPKLRNFMFGVFFITCGIIIFKIYSLGKYNNAEYGFIRCIYLFSIGIAIKNLSNCNYKAYKLLDLPVPVISIATLYFNKYFIESNITHALIELFLMPLFFSIIIYMAVNKNSELNKLLCKSPLQWLGKHSYSIYLNHALILLAVPKFIFQVVKINNNSTLEFTVLTFCICLAFLYSRFTYKYIEQRFYLKNQ